MLKTVNGSIQSGGYKRDMCIISLAYALLHTSNKIENSDKIHDDVILHEDYSWKVGMREMVENEIDYLRENIYKFMQTKEHSKIVRSIKAKIGVGLKDAISKLHDEKVQLDVLACYILYNLLFKRQKPIHQNFIDAINEERLKLIVSSYEDAGMGLMMKVKMNKLADDCIASF